MTYRRCRQRAEELRRRFNADFGDEVSVEGADRLEVVRTGAAGPERAWPELRRSGPAGP